MKKIIILFVMIMFGATAFAKDIYYCPMHPQYTSDKMGTCPICGMNLVKKKDQAQASTPKVTGYAAVHLSEEKQQLAGIRTMAVAKKMVIKTIRASGQIANDQDFYKAQVDYVENYVAYERLNRRLGKGNYVIQDAQRKLKQAELDLIHMGATEKMMAQLRQEKFPDHGVVIPNSGDILVYAQIFESDLGFVDVGQKAIIEAPAYQETYEGAVLSVDPTVDEASRSIRVRIWFKHKNPSQFKAGMFVNVRMPVELNEAIVIPKEAVMDTGLRKIVFVKSKEGILEPRVVETGFETDDGFAIKSGLKEAEQVVVNGNFLLDSESRIQAALEGFSNQAQGEEAPVKAEGHVHGQ